MPLASTDPRHTPYFDQPCVLLDTSALIWLSRQSNPAPLLAAMLKMYSLIVPTPVLYEFAFGVAESVGEHELKLRSLLSRWQRCIEPFQYTMARRAAKLAPGNIYILNPGFMEWESIHHRLIKHIHHTRAKPGKAKQELSLDALVHACARNSFSPVCTCDIDDFVKLNRIGAQSPHDGTVPLIAPEGLVRSLISTVICRDL